MVTLFLFSHYLKVDADDTVHSYASLIMITIARN